MCQEFGPAAFHDGALIGQVVLRCVPSVGSGPRNIVERCTALISCEVYAGRLLVVQVACSVSIRQGNCEVKLLELHHQHSTL